MLPPWEIVLYSSRQMRKLDIIKEKARVNVIIIITAEQQMRSIYLHFNLGHWDSSVMQDPKQETAVWDGQHFINRNVCGRAHV